MSAEKPTKSAIAANEKANPMPNDSWEIDWIRYIKSYTG